jgi:hypothetical protein
LRMPERDAMTPSVYGHVRTQSKPRKVHECNSKRVA